MKKDHQIGEIVIYEGDNGQPRIEVRMQGETVWLNQAQIVELFDSSKANISEHIKNIFTDGELEETAVVRKFRTTVSGFNSPSVKMFLICSLIFDLLESNSSTICACVSHTVSPCIRTSILG